MNGIKFIRGLWGNFNSFANEIPVTPLYNEMVYVWGLENYDKLKTLGYDVTFMGDYKLNPYESFVLKLECLIKGQEDFGEIIFIDWDVKKIKEIDSELLNDLREKEFSMPTYSYPIQYLTLNENEWVNNIIEDFKKYGWRLNDKIIIPNAGFIYTNNSTIPHELKIISEKLKIKTLVEEFSMWVYSNCSLVEYIKNYEPKCLYGRPNRPFKLKHINTYSETDLHELIDSHITKNIYFVHE